MQMNMTASALRAMRAGKGSISPIRFGRALVAVGTVMLAVTGAALAARAPTPKSHKDYFYVHHGSFSIDLVVSGPQQIASGKPSR
jgi:hypothetical protein